MLILGIETSCDETAVALYDTEIGLIAHTLKSQIDLHAPYGGVVPEIASRDHLRCLMPLIKKILTDNDIKKPDVIAYTAGPGLIGALMVGSAIANGLALAWNCKVIPIHHMEGHLMAPLLSDEPPDYPFVALLVSGGHTQLIRADAFGDYRLLGESVDDAAGEAFDKTAKLLGLPYPGGPHVAALAQTGDPDRFDFPRPMVKHPGLDFSFSGLKTHVGTCIKQLSEAGALNEQAKADVARCFEEAVVDTLLIKCRRALKQEGVSTLVMAGGVSANRRLRERLAEALAKDSAQVIYPAPSLCTDNGAMIAFAGALRLARGERDSELPSVRARWPITELTPPVDGEAA